MAGIVTYSPATHAASVGSTIAQGGATASVTGLAPGLAFTELNDARAPTTVWMSTSTTSDGFPGTMVPFTTVNGLAATASVTVS